MRIPASRNKSETWPAFSWQYGCLEYKSVVLRLIFLSKSLTASRQSTTSLVTDDDDFEEEIEWH